jgi:hypothetical protein
MDDYVVMIWEIPQEGKLLDSDIVCFNIIAASPELALRRVILDRGIFDKVYAEVLWNDGRNRQVFEDYTIY